MDTRKNPSVLGFRIGQERHAELKAACDTLGIPMSTNNVLAAAINRGIDELIAMAQKNAAPVADN